MNDEQLRQRLAGIPKPRLSAGFAAAVIVRLPGRRASNAAEIIERLYWLMAGIAAIAILSGIDWPRWTGYALLAAVPLSFWIVLSPAAALYPLRSLAQLLAKDWLNESR